MYTTHKKHHLQVIFVQSIVVYGNYDRKNFQPSIPKAYNENLANKASANDEETTDHYICV